MNKSQKKKLDEIVFSLKLKNNFECLYLSSGLIDEMRWKGQFYVPEPSLPKYLTFRNYKLGNKITIIICPRHGMKMKTNFITRKLEIFTEFSVEIDTYGNVNPKRFSSLML